MLTFTFSGNSVVDHLFLSVHQNLVFSTLNVDLWDALLLFVTLKVCSHTYVEPNNTRILCDIFWMFGNLAALNDA